MHFRRSPDRRPSVRTIRQRIPGMTELAAMQAWGSRALGRGGGDRRMCRVAGRVARERYFNNGWSPRSQARRGGGRGAEYLQSGS
jgi:hypothetical protein